MNSYKQWAGTVRAARFLEYKAGRRAGTIAAPGPCEICAQTKGTMHHAEDYGPELALPCTHYAVVATRGYTSDSNTLAFGHGIS